MQYTIKPRLADQICLYSERDSYMGQTLVTVFVGELEIHLFPSEARHLANAMNHFANLAEGV